MIDEQDLEKRIDEIIDNLQNELIEAFDLYKNASSDFDSVRDFPRVFEAFVINKLAQIDLKIEIIKKMCLKTDISKKQ